MNLEAVDEDEIAFPKSTARISCQDSRVADKMIRGLKSNKAKGQGKHNQDAEPSTLN